MILKAPAIVRVTRHFGASPERVFDAWLDPDTAGKWLFATATGRMVRIEIDARVGGQFAFVDRREGEDVEHVGEYLEINRPRRLAFTFAVPKFSSESTRVSIDIEPLGAGCELTLTHERVPPDWASRTEQGWTGILEGLAGALDRSTNDYGVVAGSGAVRFKRLLPGPIERVWAYLTESEKRGKWLASGEMDLRVGGSVDLFFHHANLSPEPEPTPDRFKQYETGHTLHAHITRCEPLRLLSFTWSGEPYQGSDVTFELTQQGEGVLLVLTHRRLTDRAEMVDVADGWHTHLGVLVDHLNSRVPRPFWSALAELDGEYEKRLSRE
jgi:uncharacterized protein YndB with AHSA1/START domain